MKAPHFGLYWSCIWRWPLRQRNIVALVFRRERRGTGCKIRKRGVSKFWSLVQRVQKRSFWEEKLHIYIYIYIEASAFNISQRWWFAMIFGWCKTWVWSLKRGLLHRNRVLTPHCQSCKSTRFWSCRLTEFRQVSGADAYIDWLIPGVKAARFWKWCPAMVPTKR